MADAPRNLVAPQRPVFAYLRCAVGVGLLMWLVWKIDWHVLVGALPRVNVRLVVLCAVFYMALQVLSAFKWQLLLRAQGVQLPLGTLTRFYFVGMFFNLFLITMVGGDVMRIYLTSQKSGRLGVVTLSVFMERLTGFVAMLVIGFVGATITPTRVGRGELTLLIIAVTACLSVVFAVLAARVALRARWMPPAMHKKLAQLNECLRAYGQQRSTLTAVMGISFAFQLSMVLLNYLFIKACGESVPFHAMAFFVPVLTIASMLPVSLNGLGVREATSVLLLRQIHIPEEVGLLTSLLWRVVTAVASVPGGLLWLQGNKVKEEKVERVSVPLDSVTD